jgi:cyclophilin family peptidyl-prolyl cis-trans isomerase
MDLAETCQSAKITTSQGVIEIKFYNEKAPTTVANFCTLAKKGFYDGVRFHRVIQDFMIQTGDPNSKDLNKSSAWGMGDPGYKFKDELPQAGEYKLGSVAMANSGPNTNGSQFFITVAPAKWLNGGYTIFGEVINGQDVVRKIENVTTDPGDRPMFDTKIKKAYLKK